MTKQSNTPSAIEDSGVPLFGPLEYFKITLMIGPERGRLFQPGGELKAANKT